MSSKCQQCGLCCRNYGITLSLQDMNREPRLWEVVIPIQYVGNPRTRAFMVENKHPFVINKGRGETCPFLLNNKCLIYETRPQICRDYPQKGAKCLRLEN